MYTDTYTVNAEIIRQGRHGWSEFVKGQIKSLSKKWARTRANGPTEAGEVRKRTREQAQKRAELGQDVTQGQISTETYKRGHRSAKHS